MHLVNLGDVRVISKIDIEKAEKEMGTTIPRELKVFLETFNGVTLQPNCFSISENDVNWNLYKLHSLIELISAYNYTRSYEELVNILPIGDTLGDGMFIGIDTNQKANGRIYLIDSSLSVKIIAGSLIDFLNMRVYEEP